ncbi:MAG: plastocyanin/azurin family copper-binding protein [Candidatus Moraniibacteriota bacterium]
MEEQNSAEVAENSKNNSSKIITGIVTGVVVIGVVYFLTKGQSATPKIAVTKETPQVQLGINNQAIKEFNLSAKPFEFSQTEIKVKKGDTVKLTLTVEAGLHDWVVDEFSAKTKQLKAGESESIVFVADKSGTFEYYCSVGTHRQMGMAGKLIVE